MMQEDVDRAPAGECVPYDVFGSCVVGQVGDREVGVRAVSLAVGQHFLEAIASTGDQADSRAPLGEHARGRGTDAGGRPGQEDGRAPQVHVPKLLSWLRSKRNHGQISKATGLRRRNMGSPG